MRELEDFRAIENLVRLTNALLDTSNEGSTGDVDEPELVDRLESTSISAAPGKVVVILQ